MPARRPRAWTATSRCTFRPSYGRGERHYPVIYMQDGQNLFDPRESFAGSWRVDHRHGPGGGARVRGDRGRDPAMPARSASRSTARSTTQSTAPAAATSMWVPGGHDQAAGSTPDSAPSRAAAPPCVGGLLDGRADQPLRLLRPAGCLRRRGGDEPIALVRRTRHLRVREQAPSFHPAGCTWTSGIRRGGAPGRMRVGCGICCSRRATARAPTCYVEDHHRAATTSPLGAAAFARRSRSSSPGRSDPRTTNGTAGTAPPWAGTWRCASSAMPAPGCWSSRPRGHPPRVGRPPDARVLADQIDAGLDPAVSAGRLPARAGTRQASTRGPGLAARPVRRVPRERGAAVHRDRNANPFLIVDRRQLRRLPRRMPWLPASAPCGPDHRHERHVRHRRVHRRLLGRQRLLRQPGRLPRPEHDPGGSRHPPLGHIIGDRPGRPDLRGQRGLSAGSGGRESATPCALWDGWAHDWPYWKEMIRQYIGGHD